MKIFGREPAVLIAVVEAAVALAVTFQLDGLSAEQATSIVALAAVIGGVLTAATTTEKLLSSLSGVGRGILLVMVSYGLNLSQEQIGIAVGLLVAVFAAFTRTQVSPDEGIKLSG